MRGFARSRCPRRGEKKLDGRRLTSRAEDSSWRRTRSVVARSGLRGRRLAGAHVAHARSSSQFRRCRPDCCGGGRKRETCHPGISENGTDDREPGSGQPARRRRREPVHVAEVVCRCHVAILTMSIQQTRVIRVTSSPGLSGFILTFGTGAVSHFGLGQRGGTRAVHLLDCTSLRLKYDISFADDVRYCTSVSS